MPGRLRCWIGLTAALLVSLPARAGDEAKKADSFRVPFQLTDTKHILVRVKINDQGPFHFILDTGAPILILGTEAAKKLQIKTDKSKRATFERFEIEGGLVIENAKGFIDDPFQLTGMNKMNLPGVRLDGIIGYTVLAQYRITYDFTKPHLGWTKLDWTPPSPFGLMDLGGKPPAELASMGALVSFASAIVGRRPDPEIIRRGFLGVELEDTPAGVRIKNVLADSPAARAGLRSGDRIVEFQGKPVTKVADVQRAAAEQQAGADIRLEVQRGDGKMEVTVTAARGL